MKKLDSHSLASMPLHLSALGLCRWRGAFRRRMVDLLLCRVGERFARAQWSLILKIRSPYTIRTLSGA